LLRLRSSSGEVAARWSQRLGLLLCHLIVTRAVAALEREVLPYRVVENPHGARSLASFDVRVQVAALTGSARSTRFLPPRLALESAASAAAISEALSPADCGRDATPKLAVTLRTPCPS